jgi:agmatine deiminase
MTSDFETDFVYLSDLLEQRFKELFDELTSKFKEHNVGWGILPGTKDIWAVDYMPIQVRKNKYVQFFYAPDYLIHSKNDRKTISDGERISKRIKITPKMCDLILDGGNVVKYKDTVLLTDKIFRENEWIGVEKKKLIDELETFLEAERIIIIPKEPYETIGHSDGMVRFIDEDTVIINQYPENGQSGTTFKWKFHAALNKAGLKFHELPYTCYKNSFKHYKLDATGLYINYLQVGKVLFAPIYSQAEDEAALDILKKLFPDSTIIPINCESLAKEGGALNCISWNIQKN